MAVNVSVPSTRIKGLMNSFANIFTNRINKDPDRERLKMLMDFIPSKNRARDETFYFLTDPPPFTRWDEGEPRVLGTLSDVNWNVPILKWQSGIQWRRIDEEDELTGGRLRQQIRAIANKASLVDIEIAFQILTGGTDPDRLASLPTGADGLSLFSSSRALFGAAGNIVAGSGVSTVAQIKADFFEGMERLGDLTDTHGDLYHPDAAVEGKKLIIFPHEHRERFFEAFQAKIIRQGEAGVENIMSSSFANTVLWPTPRLSGSDWYMHLADYPEKPIFALERNDLGGVEQILVTEDNSDYCRNNDCRQLVFRMRKGYGVSMPLATLKIDN